MIGFAGLLIGPVVSAATCTDSSGNKFDTAILPCSTGGKDGVWGLLLLAINILTAGVGVAAVGGVVYGSILYTTAGGSLDQTKQAKQIIYNVVIGLVAFALMYSFLNFLIPGGAFNNIL